MTVSIPKTQQLCDEFERVIEQLTTHGLLTNSYRKLALQIALFTRRQHIRMQQRQEVKS